LYAKKGIQGVSLRSISAAAGSKNSAAMHYHFKNRVGVLEALVTMIANELKSIHADVLQAPSPRENLRRSFIDTLRPLTELPLRQDWGVDAIQFMSRAMAENDPQIAAVINPVYQKFWERADMSLAKLVPELPCGVRKLRLMFVSVTVLQGVAEVASRVRTPPGGFSYFDNEQLLDHLVDYLIGGLKAPTHRK